MRILFVMRNTMYVRNFESTLRLLTARGHRVHVAAGLHFLDDARLVERLSRECQALTFGSLPDGGPARWALLGEELRASIDYLRYLEPQYKDSPKLTNRAARNAPPYITSLLRRPLANTGAGRRLLAAGLRFADRSLPLDPAVDDFIAVHAPDLLIVTPLVEPGSPQSRFVRSARARHLRTALCVYSWDNLTNKGLIQDELDLVTVWNDAMQREAVELHKVPTSRVAVTGAPAYDHWFTWAPRWSRDEFCALAGLRGDRPYLLYLCSSKFIAPDEAPFIRRWAQEIRSRSPILREAGVLVRPHPQYPEQWKSAQTADLEGVVIWPPAGRNPVDADSKSEYFDSIYHSAAVVGVNTSALIESAIVGRRVHTILAPEFRDTQEGTLHFRHLREAGGGLLCVANDFEEHASQLEEALRSTGSDRVRADAFLRAFVRPHGLGEPATPRLVEALERLAARRPLGPNPTPLGAWIVRRLLRSRAVALEREATARAEKQARRARSSQARAEALRARRAEKERKRIEFQEERRARLAKRLDERARLAAEEAGRAEARQAEAARAYEHYLSVRDAIRRMPTGTRSAAAPTPAERQVLAAARHIWDASPDMIATLRQHASLFGGAHPRDYPGTVDRRKAFFLDQSRLLKAGDATLLVPEPEQLGGFGHREGTPAGVRTYNDDTLKYLEVWSALDCGALLEALRKNGPRPVVLEFGGGWGGFAYQCKRLFPNATYVITAPPEFLVFSAVYLLTAFPAARARFYDDADKDRFWADLDSVDFAFAPDAALAQLPAEPASDLTLTLDLQALERMSRERARLHVEAAFRLGSRYIYSLGPSDRSPHGDLLRAFEVIGERFWTYEMPVPQYDGMTVLAGFRGAGPADGVERAHRVGWRHFA